MYNIFNDKFFGFGEPDFWFNSCVKDMRPTYLKETEQGYQITVKTIGIEAVDVTLKDGCIHIVGDNEIEGAKYNTKIDLPVSDDVIASTKEINYYTKCGVTVINLVVERKEKEIKINKI